MARLTLSRMYASKLVSPAGLRALRTRSAAPVSAESCWRFRVSKDDSLAAGESLDLANSISSSFSRTVSSAEIRKSWSCLERRSGKSRPAANFVSRSVSALGNSHQKVTVTPTRPKSIPDSYCRQREPEAEKSKPCCRGSRGLSPPPPGRVF